MRPGNVVPGAPVSATLRAVLAGLALVAAAPVVADEPPAAPLYALSATDALGDAGRWDFSLADGLLPEQAVAAADGAAPAMELADGVAVQMEQDRRKFRALALDWVRERSVAMARMADFLAGGADSGWHLSVDPRGDDQYELQWKARFR